MKLHKSLNSIPVFAYWKMQITNDLRYLIKNVDYFDLPEIEINKEFYEAQLSMFKEIEKLDLTLQELYIQTLKLTIQYLDDKTPNKEQKCNNSFHKYLKKLGESFEKFTFNDIIFTDVNEIYKLIKKDNQNIVLQRVMLLDYHKLNCENTQKWDLYKEVAKMRKELIFDIDIKNISVSEYNAYRQEYSEIMDAKYKR